MAFENIGKFLWVNRNEEIIYYDKIYPLLSKPEVSIYQKHLYTHINTVFFSEDLPNLCVEILIET